MIYQLEKALALHDKNPPDTDYQRGYLAALVETLIECRVLEFRQAERSRQAPRLRQSRLRA